jgi:hypothetical protein
MDEIKNNLILGTQFYMGLKYHMEDAYKEKGLELKGLSWSPSVAKFARAYYNDINMLNHDKKYDYCFIGSINSCYEKRIWIIEFAKKYFTDSSIFVNTDTNSNTNNSWTPLGVFDKSHMKLGFAPKEQPRNQSRDVQYRVVKDNIFYFETMCQSKYVLCPAGDAPWSFRFYETLMCKSVPIVETWHHTYRTKEESEFKYKYVLFNEIDKYRDNLDVYNALVDANTEIFEMQHLIH